MLDHTALCSALESHYGSEGYLCKALEDIDQNKHTCVAVEMVKEHYPLEQIGENVSDHDIYHHAWVTISGLLSDTYNNFISMLKNISWRQLVQAGNIPDGLDTLIKNLNLIQDAVRGRLAIALKWIGNHLKPLWDYFIEFVPSKSTVMNFLNAISFDWFVDKITRAIKYTARRTAAGLVRVFEFLRSMIYIGIEYMTHLVEGVVETAYEIGKTSRQMAVKSIFVMTTANHDLLRFAVSPKYMGLERLQALKSNFSSMSTNIVRTFQNDIRETNNANTAEEKMRNSWFFNSSFGPSFKDDEGILSWVFSFFAWLPAALKRLASSAVTFFKSTMGYIYLFHKICGPMFNEVIEEIMQTKDMSSVIQVKHNMEILLEKTDLNKQTQKSLRDSITLADEMLQRKKLENEHFVNSVKGQSHKMQYDHNEKTADILTRLFLDEVDDFSGLQTDIDKVYKTYTGEDNLTDMFILNAETVSHLEAVYALAIGDLLNENDSVQINAKAKPSLAPNPPPKEKEEDERSEDERIREEYKNYMKELNAMPEGVRKELIQAEKELTIAKKALEDFERRPASGIIRDETYMLGAKAITERFAQKSTGEKNQLEKLAQEDLMAMSLTMKHTTENSLQKKYFHLLKNMNDAFEKRQTLAMKFQLRVRDANTYKKCAQFAGQVLIVAVPMLIIFGITWRYPGVTIEKMKSVEEIFDSDAEPVTTFLGQIGTWLYNTVKKTVSPISFVETLNLRTWQTFISHFLNDASLTSIAEYPLFLRYMGGLLSSVPIIGGLGIYAYSCTYLFCAFLIDWWYSIGGEIDEQGRSTSNVLMYYWSRYFKSTFMMFAFIISNLSNFWIGSIGPQLNFVKSIFSTQGLAVVPIITSIMSPVGSIAQSTLMNIPQRVDQGKIERFLRSLYPTDEVRKKIIPLQYQEDDPRVQIRVYNSIVDVLRDLPKNDTLLTGTNVRQMMDSMQLQGSKPTIEEIDSDEEAFDPALFLTN